MSEPLNIPEAEERARLYIINADHSLADGIAHDLVALAAAYREAVEALKQVLRFEASFGENDIPAEDRARGYAVLAKARAVGLLEPKAE